MGLSAGQARLLTITGRKSDCEFESMRLSHQKIALARDLADLSNEYQNSLNQTKLIYDYYGTGDINTPLTYGVLMTPSALNDYMPTTITDSAGRVVLNGKYAAAARAAGIPQEGLGTLPGEVMRNNFILSLSDTGIITQSMAETITSLPYNQQAGFGGGATIVTQTADVTLSELAKYLQNYSTQPLTFTHDIKLGDCDGPKERVTRGVNLYDLNNKEVTSIGNAKWMDNGYTHTGYDNTGNNHNSSDMQISLGDILTGNYVLGAIGVGNRNSSIGFTGGAVDTVLSTTFWDDMFEAVEELLDTGDIYTQKALEYAKSKFLNSTDGLIYNFCDPSIVDDKECGNWESDYQWQFFKTGTHMRNFAKVDSGHHKKSDGTVVSESLSMAKDYIGLVAYGNADTGHDE